MNLREAQESGPVRFNLLTQELSGWTERDSKNFSLNKIRTGKSSQDRPTKCQKFHAFKLRAVFSELIRLPVVSGTDFRTLDPTSFIRHKFLIV